MQHDVADHRRIVRDVVVLADQLYAALAEVEEGHAAIIRQ
jgi:hypothetical protein